MAICRACEIFPPIEKVRKAYIRKFGKELAETLVQEIEENRALCGKDVRLCRLENKIDGSSKERHLCSNHRDMFVPWGNISLTVLDEAGDSE